VKIQGKVKAKTDTWECLTNKGNLPLGGVFWYTRWRKYCFSIEYGAVFDENCLANIVDFLKQLNGLRTQIKKVENS